MCQKKKKTPTTSLKESHDTPHIILKPNQNTHANLYFSAPIIYSQLLTSAMNVSLINSSFNYLLFRPPFTSSSLRCCLALSVRRIRSQACCCSCVSAPRSYSCECSFICVIIKMTTWVSEKSLKWMQGMQVFFFGCYALCLKKWLNGLVWSDLITILDCFTVGV